MKKSLLPLLLVLPLAAVPVAHADQASKDVKIKELLHVLKVDQVSHQIVEGANAQTDTLGHREFGATETPEQKKQVDDLHAKIVSLITPAVDWKTLEPEFVAAYNTAYTEPEIDGILTFYKSAPGQALLNKGPEIGQKSSQIVQARMAAVQPQLREAVQAFAKAAQPAQPAGPGPGAGTSPATRQAPAPNASPSTK